MANIILKVNTWMSQIPGNGDKSKLQDSSPPHPPPPPTSPESKALTPREGEGCSRHAQPRDGQPGWSEGAGVDRRADRHHQLPHPASASQAPPGFLQRSLQVCIPQFPLPSLGGRTSGATPSAEQMAGWSTFFIFMQQKTWVGRLCEQVGQEDLSEWTWISCKGIRVDSNLNKDHQSIHNWHVSLRNKLCTYLPK